MEIPPILSVWLERSDGGRVPLAGNCSFGRSSSNVIVIADERASRHHATIHVQDAGEYWLIDMGSINGTVLNARRAVQPQRLRDGDRITIAETTFVFRQSAADGDTSLDKTPPTVSEVRTETRWLLLADIEGFTPLSQRLPAEELATLVGQWLRHGRETVEENGGTLNKYLGDGYLACWPARARSDAEVVATVQALRTQLETAAPKFRVVVHYGTVSISGGGSSFGEENLIGPDVNFIFRAEKIAAAAGVHFCFTTAAHALLAGLLPLRPIPGLHELKGFPGSYEFFQI